MGAHILIIEDTSHSLQLMTYLLKACGHTVDGAITGEQGIELARASRPDLVMVDLQLPGIDGYQTLQAMRALPELDGTPVVAVTAFAMVGDRDRALEAGFDHYLTKPIDPETFNGEIDACLPARLRGSPPRPAGTDPAPVPEGAAAAPVRKYVADILILDDSGINQTLLRSMLEPHGYHVRTAFTIEEAIAAAADVPPDLMLSDVHVGRRNGRELLARVRNTPTLTMVPFAFITATTDWLDPLLGGGAIRIIRRPIELAALLDEIGALLDTGIGA
jgi:two-component system, cell cycle response regulator